MSATVAETFDALAPSLPAGLLAGDTADAVRAVAAQLPAELAEAIGFELPLGDERPVADFAIQLASGVARRRLAGWRGGETPAGASARAGIRTFARRWAQTGSAADCGLVSVWLEFDVSAGSARADVPAAFVTLRPDAPEALEVALEGAETIARAPLGDATRSAVDAAVAALPAGGHPWQVGTMLSRDNAPVRLCVRGLPPQSLPAYLEALSLSEAAVAAESHLDVLPAGAAVAVALDIAGGILPRAGIEVFLEGNRELEGAAEPRWDDFLGELCARGLCTAGKRAGVRAWAGVSEMRFAHLPFTSRTFRGLSHVKLDLRAGAPPVAKAYVGALPDRLSLLLSDHPAALAT